MLSPFKWALVSFPSFEAILPGVRYPKYILHVPSLSPGVCLLSKESWSASLEDGSEKPASGYQVCLLIMAVEPGNMSMCAHTYVHPGTCVSVPFLFVLCILKK